jgi:hypothetical protein
MGFDYPSNRECFFPSDSRGEIDTQYLRLHLILLRPVLLKAALKIFTGSYVTNRLIARPLFRGRNYGYGSRVDAR